MHLLPVLRPHFAQQLDAAVQPDHARQFSAVATERNGHHGMITLYVRQDHREWRGLGLAIAQKAGDLLAHVVRPQFGILYGVGAFRAADNIRPVQAQDYKFSHCLPGLRVLAALEHNDCANWKTQPGVDAVNGVLVATDERLVVS